MVDKLKFFIFYFLFFTLLLCFHIHHTDTNHRRPDWSNVAAIAGMFRMNVLLAPDPAADSELRIHLVEIQMAMSAADGARQLAPLLERPHEVLALAPPP